MLPKKLHKKLEERKHNNALRQLGGASNLIDFSSNDYLGFAKSSRIYNKTLQRIEDHHIKYNGATGSRLLSGNHKLYDQLEDKIAKFHYVASALVFNSGYDANLGLLSSVAQRGDIIFYDEYSHASIRDGIQLSHAKSYKFKHNDLKNLEKILKHTSTSSANVQHDNSTIFIVTESVFSMDGDTPDLKTLYKLSQTYNAHLIIDEAHAVGVFGKGLVDFPVFARIVTFGKALGCHGAAILGTKDLKKYLINFSRALIYTTGLSPHSVATIKCAYDELQHFESSILEKSQNPKYLLLKNIEFFKEEIRRLQLHNHFIVSNSAINCCIISGNENVKSIAKKLKTKGFDVKPILSPTVPQGKERLRFCLHSYNSSAEITEVLELLATFVL